MTADEQREHEANVFAMHLLVPSGMLRRELAKIGGIDIAGDGGDVKKLARKFGVSETLMAMRVAEECL